VPTGRSRCRGDGNAKCFVPNFVAHVAIKSEFLLLISALDFISFRFLGIND
jgi:hypothetical protein